MLINKLLGRASIHGWELRQGIESLVSQVCRARGVSAPTVIWRDDITTAAVDMNGSMYLSCPADDAVITRGVFIKYVGFVLHEILHLVYTDNSIPIPYGYLFSLWNAIEDAYIEHRGIADNMVGNIDSILRTLVDGMATEAIGAVQDWTDPRQYPFALAIYLRQHATVKVPLAQGLEPIFQGAADRLTRSTGSADNLEIARWVHDQLKKLQPEQKPEPGKDKGQESGQDKGQDKGQNQPEQDQGQPGRGEGQEPGQEPGQGEARDTGAGQESGQGGGKPGEPGQASRPAEDCQPVQVEPSLDAGGDGMGATYCPELQTRRAGYHLTEPPGTIIPVQGRLRNELRRLFENTGSTAFQPNRKAGALNTGALHRVGQSDRLFQRRLETEGVDSAVVLLLDASGSMRDRFNCNRRTSAVSACVAMHEALTLAGVAVAVVTFNDWVSLAVPFGTPSAKARTLLSRLHVYAGTSDAVALRYAHEILLRRTEARRVCMVLTDGRGQIDGIKRQIASGENLGLSTLGVGIQADISDVYPQSVNVWELDDLGRAALSQMKVAA